MNDLQLLWSWLITSSADPKKTSLAVIGTLTFFSGYVLQAIQIACTVGLACLPIDGTVMANIINVFGDILQGLLMIIGGIFFLVGLFRKFKLGRWTAAK